MAGGAGKVTGAILFAVGALIVLIAGVIVALGVNDQADNEQQGPLGLGEDDRRTQDNLDQATAGVIGMAFGGLIAIGGVIAIAVGISQRTSELKGQWVDARNARDVLVAKTGATVTIVDGAPNELESMGDAPVAVGMGRPAIIGIGAVAVLLVIGIVVVGMSLGGVGPGSEGTHDAPPGKDAGWIGNQTFDRSIPASITLLGNSQTPQGTSHEFKALGGSTRLVATVDWTPAVGGSAKIDFSIEVKAGSDWVEVATKTAGPGLELEVLGSDLSDAATLESVELRFRAFPGQDGPTNGQRYAVTLDYYRG